MPRKDWGLFKRGLFTALMNNIHMLFTYPKNYLNLLLESFFSLSLIDFLVAATFSKHMLDYKIEHIRSSGGDHKTFIGYYCKKLTSLPHTTTVHGSALYNNPNWTLFHRSLLDCNNIVTISDFNKNKIRTSLFINPSIEDIKLSKKIKTKCIEIHTGKLSRLVRSKKNYNNELKKIKKCALYAKSLGIEVHAGHGLDYKSTLLLSKINEISEFNIGHFIIGESIFFGLKNVIKKFKKICK